MSQQVLPSALQKQESPEIGCKKKKCCKKFKKKGVSCKKCPKF